ncbi:hypothetical protein G6F65_023460 [Rhizopus arrhizus]|nr:hypothetical protein G6F65_023460 [Rhizopus arrhizus]
MPGLRRCHLHAQPAVHRRFPAARAGCSGAGAACRRVRRFCLAQPPRNRARQRWPGPRKALPSAAGTAALTL